MTDTDLLDLGGQAAFVTVAGVAVPVSPVRIEAADGSRTATSEAVPPSVGDDTDAVLEAAGFAPSELTYLRNAKLI